MSQERSLSKPNRESLMRELHRFFGDETEEAIASILESVELKAPWWDAVVKHVTRTCDMRKAALGGPIVHRVEKDLDGKPYVVSVADRLAEHNVISGKNFGVQEVIEAVNLVEYLAKKYDRLITSEEVDRNGSG